MRTSKWIGWLSVVDPTLHRSPGSVLVRRGSPLLENAARDNAISFGTPRFSEVELNHRGQGCVSEAILEDYHLQAPGLERLALIVRAADRKGQDEVAVEGMGLRSIAQGFAAMGHSDEERLVRQFSTYDALRGYARPAL